MRYLYKTPSANRSNCCVKSKYERSSRVGWILLKSVELPCPLSPTNRKRIMKCIPFRRANRASFNRRVDGAQIFQRCILWPLTITIESNRWTLRRLFVSFKTWRKKHSNALHCTPCKIDLHESFAWNPFGVIVSSVSNCILSKLRSFRCNDNAFRFSIWLRLYWSDLSLWHSVECATKIATNSVLNEITKPYTSHKNKRLPTPPNIDWHWIFILPQPPIGARKTARRLAVCESS